MFLSSPLGPQDQVQAQMIGKQYMVQRLKRDLLISEAAGRSGTAQSVIRDIEQIRELRSVTASLKDYVAIC
jgi:hypothetical protein